MSNAPRVTVFMPVYNGEKYLNEAIDSILSQTFTDFELLIIDDGSTDSSADIIRSYDDKRIRFVQNEKNLKIAATRNKGLELATGEYIVLMDCDDVSIPERIYKQVAFMDKNPEVGLCGSWYKTFGNDSKTDTVEYPVFHDEIKANLFFNYVILNPTTIMRKQFLNINNLKYDETFSLLNEDHDFCLRGSFCFKLHNLPEVLYHYRQIPDSITHKSIREDRDKFIIPFFKKNLKYLGIMPSKEDLDMYYLANTPLLFPQDIETLTSLELWLNKILKINKDKHFFCCEAFEKVIGEIWYLACWKNTKQGLIINKKFWNSSLSKYNNMTAKQKLCFVIKCMIKRGK